MATTDDGTTYCICAASGKSEVFEEEMIRCGNPNCDPGWFHLTCVKLPDHPPRRLCWLCPGYINKMGITGHVLGLCELKQLESTKVARAWLAEEKRRLADEAKDKKAKQSKRDSDFAEALEEVMRREGVEDDETHFTRA